MSLTAVLTFLFGLIVITVGAEILLKGASKIATLLRIKPIIIGLTVVSVGTSLPELAVGVAAVQEGGNNIAVGNIAGTNLLNILFILGLSAAIRPLVLNLKSIKIEMYTMIVAAVLLLMLSLDGRLGWWDGILLLCLGLVYLLVIIRHSRKEPAHVQREFQDEFEAVSVKEKKDIQVWVWHFMLLFCGIIATIYGAEKLVEGAVDIARYFGMSDALIGLTIVAIGTGAPELATTLVSTWRNDRDVAIGNLLGSSITNIFIILGLTILLTPHGITVSDDLLWFDLPLAALVALVCYPVFKSDRMVSRTEGVVFVGLYIAYLMSLWMFRM